MNLREAVTQEPCPEVAMEGAVKTANERNGRGEVSRLPTLNRGARTNQRTNQTAATIDSQSPAPSTMTSMSASTSSRLRHPRSASRHRMLNAWSRSKAGV